MRQLLALAVLLAFSLPGISQDYEIKLTRSFKPGDKCSFSASASSSEILTTIVEGEEPEIEKEKKSIDFSGSLAVVEINKRGGILKSTLTVDKCVIEFDGEKSEPFKKGTEITARMEDDETIFEVDGKPIEDEIVEALGMIDFIDDPESASDDEIFGTKERKKIGDSWNINAKAAAKDIEKEELKFDIKDISGSTTIEKLVKVEGTDCLQISAELTLKGLKPIDIPDGFNVKESAILATSGGLYPVDVSKGIIEERMEMKMQMKMSGRPDPDVPAVEVIVTSEQKSVQKYDYGEKKADNNK